MYCTNCGEFTLTPVSYSIHDSCIASWKTSTHETARPEKHNAPSVQESRSKARIENGSLLSKQSEPSTVCEVDEELKIKWMKEQNAMKRKLRLSDDKIIKKICSVFKSHRYDTDEYYIGGVDLSFIKDDNENACAALVVVSFPSLKVVYEDYAMVKLTAPYIPGFLAFREADSLVERVNILKRTKPHYTPHVIMVDGNGILHPRGFGLACQLGILLDIPTLGCAKTLFHADGLQKDAEHAQKIQQLEKGGDVFPLIGDSGKTLGMALRSCDSTSNPVYISVGHKISLDSAVWLVQHCCMYRIPEPVRKADLNSREFLRKHFPGVT